MTTYLYFRNLEDLSCDEGRIFNSDTTDDLVCGLVMNFYMAYGTMNYGRVSNEWTLAWAMIDKDSKE